MRKYQQLERIAAEHNGVLVTAKALAAGVSKDILLQKTNMNGCTMAFILRQTHGGMRYI